MIRAIAIDDESPALELLENYCSQVSFIDLQKAFTKPTEAIEYLQHHEIDLVFADIQMPSISGTELVIKIPEHVIVIFTTAFSEYALESFNLNAVDYLLKPYTFSRFLQAVSKAQQLYKGYNIETEKQQILIKSEYSLIKVEPDEILYIEALDNYLKIHFANSKPLLTRSTFKTFLEKLPKNKFTRIHKSYVIQNSKIESISSKSVKIGGVTLPIGKIYYDSFKQVFENK